MTNLEKFNDIKVRAANMMLNGSQPNTRWWLDRIAELLKVSAEDNCFVRE